MSLSSLLKSRSNPVREWFESRLPRVEKFQREWHALGRPTLVRRGAPGDASLVGTAFDYRLRYLFAVTPTRELFAAQGAQRLLHHSAFNPSRSAPIDAAADLPPDVRDLHLEGDQIVWQDTIRDPFLPLADALDTFLAETSPIGRTLPTSDEAQLGRFCIVLAFFEQCGRSGRVARALVEAGPSASVEDLLALAEPAWLDDLAVLTEAFGTQFPASGVRSHALNPTFRGSRDVGGADADLILDRCLIDVKTTESTSCKREHLWQLAGYLLLDYDDEYNMTDVGLYSARHPKLLAWNADAFLNELAAASIARQELRSELRDAAKRSREQTAKS